MVLSDAFNLLGIIDGRHFGLKLLLILKVVLIAMRYQLIFVLS